jgi:MATE family multidrug resistance protein
MRLGNITIGLGLIYALSGSLLFFFFGDRIVSAYTTDPEARETGSRLIRIAAAFQFGDALQVILAGCLRGLGETRTQAVMNAIGHWGIGIPLGLYFGFHQGLGIEGLWLGLSAGLFSVAGLLLIRYRQHSRKLV